MAVKDSIGGWKDNALVYKSPKACSSLKKFLGTEYTFIMNGLGVPNASCPIHPVNNNIIKVKTILV